jgi:hypothetical protein
MKTIITFLSAVILAVTLFTVNSVEGVAQPVVQSRNPQGPTVRPEKIFSITKSDTVATDTVVLGIAPLAGTLYTSDTNHRWVGYGIGSGDTCTYTLQVRQVSPEGYLLIGGTAWTTVGSAQQFIPGTWNQFTATTNVATHHLQFRLIRARGATQAVLGAKFDLFLYRY